MLDNGFGGRRPDLWQFLESFGVSGIYVYEQRLLGYGFDFIQGCTVNDFRCAFGKAGVVQSATCERDDYQGADDESVAVMHEKFSERASGVVIPLSGRSLESVVRHRFPR